MKLFSNNTEFLKLFEDIAFNLTKGAALLVQLMQDIEHMEMILAEIQEVEREGDRMTHDLIYKLNQTSAKMDKADLYALASSLDDVIDLIWSSADRFSLFSLKETTKDAITMARDILTTTEVIHSAIIKLRHKKYSIVREYCVEINRLENKGDINYRNAIAGLFDETKDAIYIIKWKDIYERLEDALDRCEDVANILETIVLKYA